jgi:hypothetical protein
MGILVHVSSVELHALLQFSIQHTEGSASHGIAFEAARCGAREEA